MKRNKYQIGGYITPSDNTRVAKTTALKFKLTPQLLLKIKSKEATQVAKRNLSTVYDTNKARLHENLLNFYNNNFFGYGVFGKQTTHNPTTPLGLRAILSDFSYAKSNAKDFMANIAAAGLSGATSNAVTKGTKLYSKVFKGPFKTASKRGSLGTMKQYTKNGTLGSGAEAVVINNTPTTVGKITTIPLKEMMARNSIPNTVQSKYIGFVKDNGTKLPTYVLRKVRTLTDKTFPKYITKLDRAMQKSGFRKVNDPNVQYRAYTNGTVVVDDVAPGNVGLDWLGRPRMIDFNLQTVPSWVQLGFRLKNGGLIRLS